MQLGSGRFVGLRPAQYLYESHASANFHSAAESRKTASCSLVPHVLLHGAADSVQGAYVLGGVMMKKKKR